MGTRGEGWVSKVDNKTEQIKSNLAHPVLCHSKWTGIHSQEEDILSSLAVFPNVIFMGFFGILKWVIHERYRREKPERGQFLTQVFFKL